MSSPGAQISGLNTRRRHSIEFKLRVVSETRNPGAIVRTIAHRHGLTDSQLYKWRSLVETGEIRRKNALETQWASLKSLLAHWETEHDRSTTAKRLLIRLAGFMRFCAENGYAPDQVTDDTIVKYIVQARRSMTSLNHIRNESFVRNSWNYAVDHVPGWPAVRVTAPINKKQLPIRRGDHLVCFAEHQFHPSLVAEVKRYREAGGFLISPEDQAVAKLSHRDRMKLRLKLLSLPSDASEPRRPYPARPLRRLSHDTVYTQGRLIFLTATALHLAGEADIRNLRSITDVMTPKGAALLSDSYEARLGKARGLSAGARSVRYFNSIVARCGIVFPAKEREVLRELQQDLYAWSGPTIGISERNLRKLAQFDDNDKFSMLVALPDVMMSELEHLRRRQGKASWYQARRAKWAVAMDILNSLPIRRDTLIKLDLDRNFIKTRGAAPKLLVYADQEKTGKVLEARLSARTWKLIRLYRKRYRPLLPGADRSDYLFPALTSTGYTYGQSLARGITQVVKDRVGVHINPHLWRHLMSTKLAETTHLVENAEKLLAHAPGSRATRRYARLRTKEAAELLRMATDAIRPKGVKLLHRQCKAPSR